jgi:hypothetical protein
MTDFNGMLKLLLEIKKEIAFVPEYRASATDEETLGILISQYLQDYASMSKRFRGRKLSHAGQQDRRNSIHLFRGE